MTYGTGYTIPSQGGATQVGIIKQFAGGPAIASVARVSRARSFVHHSGTAWVCCDHEAFEYYVDSAAGAPVGTWTEIQAQMRAWGLEPDEELTFDLDGGMTRTVFSPIVPLSDEEIAWLAGVEVEVY